MYGLVDELQEQERTIKRFVRYWLPGAFAVGLVLGYLLTKAF